jgi:hypothetical protein
MARRRKKKGRRKKQMAVPLIQTGIVAYPVWKAYKTVGLTGELPAYAILNLTGYNVTNNQFDMDTAIKTGGALILAQFIGGKIASKTGANRLMKKLSMGYLKVA